jgi:dTDP-4-dehydrorhamnose reductase
MKYLILGDGLLGGEIIKQTGWNYISRKKDNINVCDPITYFKFMVDYDVIINCIAYTNTYSDNREMNWKINYKFVDDLINFCNNNGKKLVHISTDYIYSGSKDPTSETDVPVHLETWYGYTKLLSDGLVQLKSKNYLLCRLSHKPNPFSYENAWIDMKTNCDYVDVISSLLIKLIKNDSTGVFNVGTEPKTIYDLALKTKDVTPILKPIGVPSNTLMDLSKLNLELNQ